MAREFVHEATGDAQVRCVAVRPSHVLHGARAAASKKTLQLRGDVARALRDTPVSQWDAVRSRHISIPRVGRVRARTSVAEGPLHAGL